MTNPVVINTILLIAYGSPSDLDNSQIELRVGSVAPTPSVSAINDVCWPTPSSGTGWYQCATTLSGTHVTVRVPTSTSVYLVFHEVLAYTEFAIQHNALSVSTSSILPGSSSSFVLSKSSIDATSGN